MAGTERAGLITVCRRESFLGWTARVMESGGPDPTILPGGVLMCGTGVELYAATQTNWLTETMRYVALHTNYLVLMLRSLIIH